MTRIFFLLQGKQRATIDHNWTWTSELLSARFHDLGSRRESEVKLPARSMKSGRREGEDYVLFDAGLSLANRCALDCAVLTLACCREWRGRRGSLRARCRRGVARRSPSTCTSENNQGFSWGIGSDRVWWFEAFFYGNIELSGPTWRRK